MISNLSLIFWTIALIIGAFGLVYEFFLFLKLKFCTRIAYGILYLGLLSGYFSAVLMFLFELNLSNDLSASHYFLMIAVCLISFGSIKLIIMISYIPESFLNVLNKTPECSVNLSKNRKK